MTSPVIALDGPSALMLYRDRSTQKLGAADVIRDQNELEQNEIEAYDAWPSDEGVAEAIAESNVFGRQSYLESIKDNEITSTELPPLTTTQARSIKRCSTSARDLKQIPYERLGIMPPSKKFPLHILSPDRQSMRHVVGVHERSCSATIPARSLYLLDGKVLVPTPEFTFLLMASYLNIYGMLMLGMELCGHYRLGGAPVTGALCSGDAVYNQRPLTTRARIERLLGRSAAFPGVVVARRACKFLENGSASPMETALYLLLCLPRNLGGYGLRRPLLNAKRAVTEEAGSFTFANHLVPDLYWPDSRLDLEYDSDEFHSDPASLAAGARRTLALRSMNVDVIQVTSDIVYNPVSFHKLARLVGRTLGQRVYSPTDNVSVARRALQNAVLFRRETNR